MSYIFHSVRCQKDYELLHPPGLSVSNVYKDQAQAQAVLSKLLDSALLQGLGAMAGLATAPSASQTRSQAPLASVHDLGCAVRAMEWRRRFQYGWV
jgi:hypothetical protein